MANNHLNLSEDNQHLNIITPLAFVMVSWRSNLIEAYRYSTLPYRAWQMRHRRNTGQVPVYVVYFHRISDTHPNPWTMSCRDFQRQIDWLEKNFQIVCLQESQRRIASGHNTQPTLSITFDDGYAENCVFALPMLIERRIPVTYFVTLQHTVHQQSFPHDLQLGTPLPVNSIESLRALDISGIEIGAHTRNHPDLDSCMTQNKYSTKSSLPAASCLTCLIAVCVTLPFLTVIARTSIRWRFNC